MSAPAWEIPLNKDNWRDYVWETYLRGWPLHKIEFLADILEDGWKNRAYASAYGVVDLYTDPKYMRPEEFMKYVEEANRE